MKVASKKERRAWIFTKARREALRKAQREHVRLVNLGKRVRAKV